MTYYLLHYVDLVALAVTWWCSVAALAGGHIVYRVRDLAVALGLLGAMVFSFVGFIYLWVTDAPSMWWATGLRTAGAVLLTAFYEYRFGVARHLRMAIAWARALPGCVKRRWDALRQPRHKGAA